MTNQDSEIIAWSRDGENESNPLIMYIFPKTGDNIKQKRYFAVKDYEKALFYDRGQLCGEFAGGVYTLNKESRVKGTEIIWFNTAMIPIPWGIPENAGIPTKDGFLIGLFGDLKLRISNVGTFFTDLVGGGREWNVQDLKNWIKGVLHTSLRDIFQNLTLTAILAESRERIANAMLAKITDDFLHYGLTLESFNILGFKYPPDAQPILDLPKREALEYAQVQDETRIQRAQHRQNVQERINELNTDIHSLEDGYIAGAIDNDTYESKKIALSNLLHELETELEKLQNRENPQDFEEV
ncbi:MAG: hypothetical protein RBG13Loki_3653 [Promethearchaeota archaeon CR_4]|nr:MAG: hypothetical protein RBG13Loki_3653 [Candidatus Lokiarchaeota archaeon CR_4]